MDKTVKIKVIGVGGAGLNTVNRMIKYGLTGVEFWVMNTDVQLFEASNCKNKVQLGKKITMGLGCGGDIQIGEEAAKESEQDIKAALKDADMVFVVAGFGGGRGTGAAPVIAKIAKDMGILTVVFVTRPFSWEGQKITTRAEEGIEKLKKYADAVAVIPNDKLLNVVDREYSLADAFSIVDETLYGFVKTISDIITLPGMINVEFDDLKNVLQNSGSVLMCIGEATGENRATKAAKMALHSESLESPLKGASGVIASIKGDSNTTLSEISDVANVINDALSDDTAVIIGTVIDENASDKICVTVIATGFDKE